VPGDAAAPVVHVVDAPPPDAPATVVAPVDASPASTATVFATVPPGWRFAPEVVARIGTTAQVWVIRPDKPTPHRSAATIVAMPLGIPADALEALAAADDAGCGSYGAMLAPSSRVEIKAARRIAVGALRGCEIEAVKSAGAPLYQHSYALTDGTTWGIAFVCSRDPSGDPQVDAACAAALPTLRSTP
jgi:hypothetical protein